MLKKPGTDPPPLTSLQGNGLMMERQHKIKELLWAAEAQLRANPKAAATIIEGLTREASA